MQEDILLPQSFLLLEASKTAAGGQQYDQLLEDPEVLCIGKSSDHSTFLFDLLAKFVPILQGSLGYVHALLETFHHPGEESEPVVSGQAWTQQSLLLLQHLEEDVDMEAWEGSVAGHLKSTCISSRVLSMAPQHLMVV